MSFEDLTKEKRELAFMMAFGRPKPNHWKDPEDLNFRGENVDDMSHETLVDLVAVMAWRIAILCDRLSEYEPDPEVAEGRLN